MAAVYAAVVSLLQLIEQIQLHNAHRPIFLDEQLRHIKSLYAKVRSLQGFLECYFSRILRDDIEALERRIADAAYAAEDIIDLYIVDDIILPKKENEMTNLVQRKESSTHFSQGIQKVIEEMDFCWKEAVMIEENSGLKDQPSGHLAHSGAKPQAKGQLNNPSVNNTMVGFDDHLNQIMETIVSHQSNLQIVPITGMGGIGKTTLATNIYHHQCIVKNFDVRSWSTISQTYDIREILLSLLREVGVRIIEKEERESEHELGLMLFQHLSGRKYFIVIDDLWSTDAWDILKMFFPDNNNGSRVVVTTRLSNVANYFGCSYIHEMNLLDENTSWRLLCSKVFVHEQCPPELEEIGTRIAKNCQGLPLSIGVIGGLLAKSKMTQEFWEYVAKYTKQIVHSEDNDHCLEILSLSYSHLPIHLKPCFLYMGVFPEDHKIWVSELINLWDAEGFLKPKETNNSLKEVAKEYLQDLADRNLILVDEWSYLGSIKKCSIHDLLRNLCIREARREKFFCVTNLRNIDASKVHDLQQISRDINYYRRIVIDSNYGQYGNRYDHQISHALPSTTFVRSVSSNFYWKWSLPLNFRLLRLFNGNFDYVQGGNLVNLRHLVTSDKRILSTVGRLWNLQSLVLEDMFAWDASLEIWELLHLRYLKTVHYVELSDPRSRKEDEENDYLVLENLQRLGYILNCKFTEDIIMRIPNIKKLEIAYSHDPRMERSELCLYNLGRLCQLQSLYCKLPLPELDLSQDLMFPYSLKKLKLNGHHSYHLEDMATKVGLLPNLQKLRLADFSSGGEWNSVDGQFIHLIVLEIFNCGDLKCWTADSSHFPVLERLSLWKMDLEIPYEIRNITTLKSIHLFECSESTIASAKVILEEQQSYGNEDLRLSVSGIYEFLDSFNLGIRSFRCLKNVLEL